MIKKITELVEAQELKIEDITAVNLLFISFTS